MKWVRSDVLDMGAVNEVQISAILGHKRLSSSTSYSTFHFGCEPFAAISTIADVPEFQVSFKKKTLEIKFTHLSHYSVHFLYNKSAV